MFTAMIGTTVFREWGDGLFGTGWDVPNNSWEFADISIANGIVNNKTSGSYVFDERKLSYFTRLQYDYKGKYLASFMMRRDASTRFGPDNVAAFFPSGTVGWVLTDEPFLKDVNNVELIKLRGSYGILGSDKIPNRQYLLYLATLDGEAMYVFRQLSEPRELRSRCAAKSNH
jgi:hypothetical protein